MKRASICMLSVLVIAALLGATSCWAEALLLEQAQDSLALGGGPDYNDVELLPTAQSAPSDAPEADPLPNGVVGTGKCGPNVSWKLEDTGLLTLYGKGDMDAMFAFWDEFPLGAGIRKVVVKKGVTSISMNCFSGCYELESVSLPSGLKNIYASAFNDCRMLRQITIPNGISYIAGYAFADCSRLESVKLPSTVKGIEQHAFENCASLKRADLPKAVTSIKAAAFKNCTRLKTAVLRENVCQIADDAFGSCPSLTIQGYSGTVAQRYARAHSIPFSSLGKVQITAIKLNKSGTVTLKKGKTLQLKATLTPRGALTELTWSSSKKKVATVSKSGKVKAVGKGTATITVKTAGGLKASVKINVK